MERKNKQKGISILAGISAGILTDGFLRLKSGNDGNLLVHSVVFLGSFLIVYAIVRLIFKGREKYYSEKALSDYVYPCGTEK